MNTPWGYPDFDAHEAVHFVTDEASGLKAVIAVHSTYLGPAAGGSRFWHYADDCDALTDALRLSRGMSYKNAMAGLPLGGGKTVILANEERTKTPELLAAFGEAVDSLGGRYVTAEDVGMSVTDMIEVARHTKYVAGLPAAQGQVGGDPGPHTSLGVFLGLKAAVKRKLGAAKFFSATYRLFKLDGLEPACEDYGQAVVYKGSVAEQPDAFELDGHHLIERGKAFPVCGNTWCMLADTRFRPHFDFIGDFSTHYGIFPGCGTSIPFASDEAPKKTAGGCC